MQFVVLFITKLKKMQMISSYRTLLVSTFTGFDICFLSVSRSSLTSATHLEVKAQRMLFVITVYPF